MAEMSSMDDMIRGKLWLKGSSEGMRLMGVNMKIQPGSYLLILKVVTAEGPKVAFRQVGTMEGVYRELQQWDQISLKHWKEDKFALDRSGT